MKIKLFNKKPKPEDIKIDKSIKISIVRDDAIDAFGAYVETQDTILFNVEGSLIASIENKISFKELMVEILMHEFGHKMEELLELEFSEKRIEKMVESYKKKYGNGKK